ncbi:cupin domain-containing protein [Shewanella sp. 202IG2-18]|uniref:cupin domain-containing protein n=1 Tax=Parashewanella hymeniacidonis TaxID=2807618 RepID=UPI0019610DB1|nr:cupin domain-containing protein [Parashewanella hymeniacidonis]MBM7071530.1 cupin domain-containing protein [Parashewanella hymeniacidonis]
MLNTEDSTPIMYADILLPSKDLNGNIAFFIQHLNFKLESIYPADNPRVAVLSGFGIKLEIDTQCDAPSSAIVIDVTEEVMSRLDSDSLVAPNGTQITFRKPSKIEAKNTPIAFCVNQAKDNDNWITGRAGMLYRDLITERLRGRIIASHIRIPKGGPVPDSVHYHKVEFQLIYCLKGWVKVVYEDQGEPFIFSAGDCVIQPPEIRHRVLESGDELEVLELSLPASHLTCFDHNMTLPNNSFNPSRCFSGTQFVHHIESQTQWLAQADSTMLLQHTGIGKATSGLVEIQTLKSAASECAMTFKPSATAFVFIRSGDIVLTNNQDMKPYQLSSNDAFVLPAGTDVLIEASESRFELITAIFFDIAK